MQELFVTLSQLKAARALLNWSQEDLSNASGISIQTIKRIEASDEAIRTVKLVTLQKIVTTFKSNGIKFSTSEKEVSVTHSKD